jgi:hypothetical protein
MGPKKGKSLEEKRETLLKIYHDTKQPFNLKEIEKVGSAAGVVQQVIKEVNQSLVDDSLVQSDKIGSGVFFWSFPSKELQNRLVKKEGLEVALQRSEASVTAMREAKLRAEEGRGSADRPHKMARLEALAEEAKSLTAVLEVNLQNDPEEVRRIEKAGDKLKDSANRWVDNTYAVKSFLTKKRGMASREVDKYLGIDDNFDYFDDAMIGAKSKIRK